MVGNAIKTMTLTLFFTIFILTVCPPIWKKKVQEPKQKDHNFRSHQNQSQVLDGPQSTSLELKSWHSLLLDPTVVMKLKLIKGSEHVQYRNTLYIRTNVYQKYENGKWHPPDEEKVIRDHDDSKKDGWVTLQPELLSSTRKLVHQEIRTYEPLHHLAALADPAKIKMTRILFNAQAILKRKKPITHYRVISALTPEFKSLDRYTDWNHDLEHQKGWLQLSDSDRLILSKLGYSNQGRSWYLIKSLLRLLENRYTYSLDAFKPAKGQNTLDFFLNQKKSGFCIHFATSLTLMLRHSGIPSRLVTGFSINTNGTSKTYDVPYAAAHAWTEFYVENIGWVAIDATPGTTEDRMLQAHFDSFKKEPIATSVANDWYDNIQPELRDRFYDLSTSIASKISRFVNLETTLLLIFIFCISIVGIILIIFLIFPKSLQRRLLKKMRREKKLTTITFYQDFINLMEENGTFINKASTVKEFHQKLQPTFPKDDLDLLESFYCKARYKNHPMTRIEEKKIKQLLSSFEKILKNHKDSK